MVIFPNAKINIGLRITAKRSDGYHNIESIFYPVKLSDALEFVVPDEVISKDILKVTGIDIGNDTDNNLVIRRFSDSGESTPFRFWKIHLHKVIPVGAGLGGGSFGCSMPDECAQQTLFTDIEKSGLKALALELGSDCPFFIDGIPSLGSGRGEILAPVKTVVIRLLPDYSQSRSANQYRRSLQELQSRRSFLQFEGIHRTACYRMEKTNNE